MAKTLKRAVSLLLIVLMVATCVWSAFSVQAASDVLFKDEFTSSTLSGWSANNVGTISGGQYTIDGTGANAAATLGSKKGVAIFADVAIDRTAAGNNGSFYNGGTAGLVFHASQDLANGYTFGLGVTKSGTVSAMVTLASGGSTKIVYQRATKIAGVAGGKLKRGTAYSLKVLMEGDTFACYINNELFYKCDAPAVKEGYIGVSSWCAKGMFDNFAVREMGERVLESIRLENTPAEITTAGYFEFDIIANYAGVYGAKKISSESAGVTVTGLDGKLGQKTLTVNYGGKSAQFTTNVVKSTEGEVIYTQDFSGELQDWTLTENTKAGSNRMQVKNGRLYATMPSSVSGSYSLMANYKKVDAVEDCYYAISVDATMTQNSVASDENRDCVAVLRFVKADGTWQFRLYSTGVLRLYNGSTTLVASGEVEGIALNKTANMRVEVRGNSILCFVDNKEILSSKTTAENIAPYLGLSMLNGSGYFDNFKVIKLEKKSKWAAKSIYVENELGEKTTSYVGRAFNAKKYSLNVTYIDGTTNSVLLSEDMLQGYDPSNKKTQNVKVFYGNKSVNFAVAYKDYIYYNDFSKSLSGIVSQGNSYAKTHAPYVHKNGMVYVNYTAPANKASVSRYFYINDSAEYANYSVSADIAMLGGDRGKGQYAGITVRDRSGHYFSMRLAYTLGGLELQLLHYYEGVGNSKYMKTWPQGDLLDALGDGSTALNLGTLYNYKLEIIDNELYCYFNNVLIGTATETAEAYTCTPGAASVFCMNTGMIVDNVCVTPLDKRYMTDVEIRGDNVKDGVLQVYQGFEIDPYSTEMVINHNDGFVATEPLWRDYIVENYDPAVLGEQTITVEYKGVTAKARVNVTDRPDYVAAFAAKVKAFKKGSLTTADLPALNEMSAYQKTLSSYEFEHLDQEVQKAYADLLVEMDRLENDKIKDVDLIYYNDFNDPNEFGTGTSWEHYDRSGYIGTSNGNMIVEMNKFATTTSALVVQPNSYGEIKSVEADVMLILPATHIALVVYDTTSGNYYHVRLSNKVLDENGVVMYTIQLYKMAGGGQVKLLQVYTATKNVVVEEGKWNNLRLDLDNGILSIYVDNILVTQYDDTSSTDYIVDGSAGIRISENDAKIANLRVYGTKKEMPKNDYVKQNAPTEYKDDFEDETVGKSPSHWIEDNYTDYWKVFNKGGNKVYGISNQMDSWTWLHGFERNPIYNAKIMVTKGTGKAGLLARVTDKVSYLEMGYDFAQKKWYIEADGSEDVETQTYYAQETSAFTLGEWHELETVVQEATVTIKFDGKEVLSYDATKYATIGRMGAYVKGGADLYLDNVYVKSVIGTVFQDGVLEYVINGVDRVGTMELEDLTNDHILGVYGYTKYLVESFDGGQTFEPVKPDSAYYETSFEGGYPSIMDLGNGKWMRIMDGYLSQVSYDNMVTWGETNEIYPNIERYDPIYGKNLSMVHTNTLTRYKMADGTMRIFCPVAFRNVSNTGSVLGHYTRFFYTDDDGKTWKEAENDTRDFAPIYNNSVTTTWAEGKVVQCADGTLRYYQTRNVVGALIYFESTDGGVTWGNFGTIPHMQAPKGSYSVEQDPYNPGTYYLTWVNCYPNNLGNILPRTRISLARSTDGKNWEFLCDIDYTSDFHTSEHNNIRQIVDPSICVGEDYVHVTFSRASKYELIAHNHLLLRYCRLEKDKLTAHAWDDSNIYDSTQAASIKIATLPQTKFGYSDLFSTAGLEIEVTAINGNKTIEGPKEYDIVVEPNMFKLGKQTITLMSKNYLFTSYEIEVVPNYDLIWTIKGKGTIDPNPDATLRIMEGATQTFTMDPATGYKVGSVVINGEKVKVTKNTFTIENAHDNQEITVTFVKLTVMDYLVWIILGVVLVAGIAVGAIFLIKKQKKKATGEMEDISSNSETPSDEN